MEWDGLTEDLQSLGITNHVAIVKCLSRPFLAKDRDTIVLVHCSSYVIVHPKETVYLQLHNAVPPYTVKVWTVTTKCIVRPKVTVTIKLLMPLFESKDKKNLFLQKGKSTCDILAGCHPLTYVHEAYTTVYVHNTLWDGYVYGHRGVKPWLDLADVAHQWRR